MGERLRFAVLGCGSFARHFGRYLLEQAEITALCDVSCEAMARCAAALEIDVPLLADYAEAVARDDVDAVAVCGPNGTHAPMAIAAARAGKHVFCEKAMALDTRECWAMVKAANDAGVRLIVGHKRRLRPPWARVAELAKSGRFGPVVSIVSTGYHSAHYGGWWREKKSGGGLLHLSGPHEIDWFRCVCGDIESVTAVSPGIQMADDIDYPDNISATFQFKSGSIASLHISLIYPILKFRESFGPYVVCREGGIQLRPSLDHIEVISRRVEGEWHIERFDDLGFDHAFRTELRGLIDWIQDGTPPPVDWECGLRAVEAMEAAYRSAEQGGAPIKLPLYPDLEP